MTTYTHPYYATMIDLWKKGKHSYEGEDTIKAKGTKYLPATSGQKEDGQGKGNVAQGELAYQAYKQRAVYPEIYKEAIETAIGLMHKKPPVIELPSVLEPLREKATLLGESLEMLLRRINVRQLMTGRIGILGDIRVDENNKARPYLFTYNDVTMLNWDDTSTITEDEDVRFVLLDESSFVMGSDFNWTTKNRYRLLALVNSNKEGSDPSLVEGKMKGYYGTSVFEDQKFLTLQGLTFPQINGQYLNKLPFVFINAKDLSPTPEMPPLNGLANLCLAIYRGEADYRQSLFQQGQDTLVTKGPIINQDPDEPVRTGVGAHIELDSNGEASYIGVQSTGLSEQRTALENDYKRADQKAGKLLDTISREKESGDALKIRVEAQAITLPQIAMSGAAGLEKVLKIFAEWYGANPNEVKVTPNLEYVNMQVNGDNLVKLMQGKTMGAPLAMKSIHSWLRESGFTDKEYEEELRLIEEEAPALEIFGVSQQQQNQDQENNNNEDDEDDEDEEDN